MTSLSDRGFVMAGENMDNLSSLQACLYEPGFLDNTSVGTRDDSPDNLSMRAEPPKEPAAGKDPEVSKFYADFAARLVALRVTMDYSQETFADLLRLPRANYIKYESRSKFPLHAIPRLASLTKESIDAIVTGKGIKMFKARIVK